MAYKSLKLITSPSRRGRAVSPVPMPKPAARRSADAGQASLAQSICASSKAWEGGVAHRVVIELPHVHAGIEQAQRGSPVALHRQVDRRSLHRRRGLHALEQRDVAL